ncbi:hypothetical protein NBRC10512_003037 [Rhodotorula toruloides]|uniref:RHTO0S17e01618g1_1 n=2 Tax=Rhodotorula toruloides TaxID=5286 RepID=A0A061BK87_RHOTO|nr:protein of eukaryotic translation initiation factor SUI1 family [Rhodotorula toruloides NP11]EMS20451.1 protein of eukaryotic translation initiation factor SUI1 family [Rhodotorula toruloides NP11]CDR48344.1 RHTO0S17e01618g1_1 [Rhodotorula toruloides]
MFKRPLSAKTSSPLRSSDLRKLRDEVVRSFSLADTAAAKALLPDGTLSCKATTHLDEPCTLYLTPGGDPRFFRVGKGSDGQLVPTCYAFDIRPDMLPVLATAEAVVENLVSGSALFAAGVSPHTLSRLPASIQPGSLVAITVASDSSQRVVAVGQLGCTKEELVRMQQSEKERKGKAVITLHARGDYLWATGSAVDAPLPERTAEPASTNDSAESLADNLASSTLDDSSAPTKADDASAPTGSASSTELSPSDVDQILLNALLLAICTSLSTAQFPLPASLLYSSHILPARPATLLSTPAGPGAAEIKKSSFKKLDRLIKAAVKKGYITAKEMKGEWVVQSVNAKHADVETLRPYKTIANEEKAQAREAKKDEEKKEASEAGAKGDPEVTELWKLSGDSVKELFRSVEHERPPQDLYTASQLSTLLRRFTDTHSVAHPSHRSLLLLTPSAHPSPSSLSLESEAAIELLARCVLKKGETPDQVGKEKGSPGCITREEALKRIRKDGCTGYWALRKGKNGEESVKKGSPPTIKVAIKNVGKRQVTLVSGHEPWDLFSSDEFAEELKHRSASSTSIQPIAGSAKKGQANKVEIMCQGTHDALVVKLLTARGVPRAYIDVDTSKSKK